MTLGKFFTKYVYIPLGGNRCTMWKQIRNILIVFLLSGIWHGANWTFVLWGLSHGIMQAIEKIPWIEKINNKIRWLFTFLYLTLTWVLFRANTVAEAGMIYKKMFSFSRTGAMDQLMQSIGGYENHILYLFANHYAGAIGVRILYIGLMFLYLLIAVVLCTRKDTLSYVNEKQAESLEMGILAVLTVMSVLTFSGVAVFLYFNF